MEIEREKLNQDQENQDCNVKFYSNVEKILEILKKTSIWVV